MGVLETKATASTLEALPCVDAEAGERGTAAVVVEEPPPPHPASRPRASKGSTGRHARVRITAPPFKTLRFILARRLSARPKAQRKLRSLSTPTSATGLVSSPSPDRRSLARSLL